jgi:hypothetical protein
MTVLGGILLYLGLIGAVAGAASLVIPIRFLGIRSRRQALAVLAMAVAAFVAGVYLPVDRTYATRPDTALDMYAPVYQFSEFHSVSIHASKQQVYAAIHEVTAGEIRFFHTLMWIRFGGRGLADRTSRQPILDAFTAKTFTLLADDPDEILFGRSGQPRGGSHPGEFIEIAMNFRTREVDPAHTILTTETRVYATGSQTVHGFAAYWRMIYPGSALIRRMWLRAIQMRAESASAASVSALH